jgi:hypothetical protein
MLWLPGIGTHIQVRNVLTLAGERAVNILFLTLTLARPSAASASG